MPVETFEVTEVTDKGVEVNEEQIDLINSLGLEGQKKLISPNEVAVNPYRKMLKEEWAVYKAICPEITAVDLYDDEAIPVRVLQVLCHAKAENLFKEYYIMHKKSEEVKDPILFGVNSTWYSEWGMPSDCFILARWGAELEDFATLKEKAKGILLQEKLQNISGVIKKLHIMKDMIKNETMNILEVSSMKIDDMLEYFKNN